MFQSHRSIRPSSRSEHRPQGWDPLPAPAGEAPPQPWVLTLVKAQVWSCEILDLDF